MSSGDTSVLSAPVQWAQRKDRLYLTICLEDVQEQKLDLTESRLTFSGVGGTDRRPHAVAIDFYKGVDPEESRQLVNGREIVMSIRKKEAGPYWPRLTAEAGKRHWLKTDFNRWVDEDETADDGEGGGGGGFGGYGGGGGDDNLEAMMAQLGGGFGGGGGGGGGGFGGEGGEDDDEDLDGMDGDDEADDETAAAGAADNGKAAEEEEEVPPPTN